MRYCFLYICADLRSQPYSQSSANIARPLIRASVSLSRDMPVCFPSFHQVYLDGQRLRHESHPTYLRVTPDCTLSYRENLKKTAGKLKNRNNLLMKLAGSTWDASANTLRSSALALCYSQQSTAPQSAHTSQVDVQLNSTMRLISGTLRSTPLP